MRSKAFRSSDIHLSLSLQHIVHYKHFLTFTAPTIPLICYALNGVSPILARFFALEMNAAHILSVNFDQRDQRHIRPSCWKSIPKSRSIAS